MNSTQARISIEVSEQLRLLAASKDTSIRELIDKACIDFYSLTVSLRPYKKKVVKKIIKKKTEKKRGELKIGGAHG